MAYSDPVSSSSSSASWTYAYDVENGEGLNELASRFQVSQDQLIEANRDTQPQLARDKHTIRADLPLNIPMGEGGGVMPRAVELKEGQTLKELSQQTHTPLYTLQHANRHELNAERTIVGQGTVWVPGKRNETSAKTADEKPATEAAAESGKPTENSAPAEGGDAIDATDGDAQTSGAGDDTTTAKDKGADAKPEGEKKPDLKTYNVTISRNAADAGKAWVANASMSFPITAESKLRLSGGSAWQRLDAHGETPAASTQTTRLGVDATLNLRSPDFMKLSANAGALYWITKQTAEPKSVSTTFIPTADLNAQVPLGAGFTGTGKAGAYGVFPAGDGGRAVPLWEAGVKYEAGRFAASAQVHQERELQLNGGGPENGHINVGGEFNLKMTDNITVFAGFRHGLQGHVVVQEPVDVARMNEGTNKIYGGLKLNFEH